MRPLRYSINVTLDGCCDHRVGIPDEQLHQNASKMLAAADALIFGRVTYEMMEQAWRWNGTKPEWMADWMVPFAKTIDAAKKYVVSSTLKSVDWNSELIQGDVGEAIRKLKEQPGNGLYVGGVTLPLMLADLGLIEEYEFIVHPVIAGHGPRLLDGLKNRAVLKLTGREELRSGAVALRYVPSNGATR